MTVALVRRALGLCCLLCPALCLGLDDSEALVQGAVRAGLGQPEDLLRQAEEVLEVVGPLDIHKTPTVEDKESLLTAQALMKNPALLRMYGKKSDKKAASSGKEASSGKAAEKVALESKAAGKVALESKANSTVPSTKTVSKHTVQTGKCTAGDKAAMEALGGGNAKTSFPGLAAKCGKKAFGLSGVSKETFLDCFLDDARLTPTCGECFIGAASYGVQHCAMKCMLSWCSSACLQCAQSYRAGPLLQCVGFSSPEAEAC